MAFLVMRFGSAGDVLLRLQALPTLVPLCSDPAETVEPGEVGTARTLRVGPQLPSFSATRRTPPASAADPATSSFLRCTRNGEVSAVRRCARYAGHRNHPFEQRLLGACNLRAADLTFGECIALAGELRINRFGVRLHPATSPRARKIRPQTARRNTPSSVARKKSCRAVAAVAASRAIRRGRPPGRESLQVRRCCPRRAAHVHRPSGPTESDNRLRGVVIRALGGLTGFGRVLRLCRRSERARGRDKAAEEGQGERERRVTECAGLLHVGVVAEKVDQTARRENFLRRGPFVSVSVPVRPLRSDRVRRTRSTLLSSVGECWRRE